MVRISLFIRLALPLFLVANLTACVTTAELYADYDEEHCNFVLKFDEAPEVEIELPEPVPTQYYSWVPAVYFDFDSSELNTFERQQLVKTIDVLKRFPHLHLGLQGFADRIGSVEYNLMLSRKRAESVKTHLLINGVADARVLTTTFGEPTQSLAADGLIDDADNRRVDLMLVDKEGRAVPFSYTLEGGKSPN